MGKFSYRVTDNSMSGDRIYIGDEVIIEETQSYLPDDICAIINQTDISTLEFRRIEPIGDSYRLVASNSDFKGEIRKEVEVIGKVLMTYRSV
ncbi:LexA family protein [Paenibacillus sp. FSL R7-0333]|uniref:LexA family protein n=1 Tax=Paenibacillus sp. FSL R7-0333 TaxID=1926587 RepID=UPI00096C96BA|nr:hypothetical protein BK146_16815 [Paenibacillus sp. FSL R7-0333]